MSTDTIAEVAISAAARNESFFDRREASAELTREAALEEAIVYAANLVAPLWPLADFVAVNPFLGLVDRKFVDARAELRSVRRCETLMPSEHFASLIDEGRIEATDIAAALERCKREYPQSLRNWTAEKVQRLVREDRDSKATRESERLELLSERIDREVDSDTTSLILDAVSRCCAAHYDEGQALWPSPWKGLTLYDAWRGAAQFDRLMEVCGIAGFRKFVGRLPKDPRTSIAESLRLLNVPDESLPEVIAAALFSVSGWAAYLKRRDANESAADDLAGLIAIRLIYEAALAEAHPSAARTWSRYLRNRLQERSKGRCDEADLARYVLQTASENAFQRRLLDQIAPAAEVEKARPGRSLAQMVFCIDVRSETLRRRLEQAGEGTVETFGFAGFFGIACEQLPLGEASGPAQCPVLLTPAYRAVETSDDESTDASCVERRRLLRSLRKVWKRFQTSALSCFSFVESTGLAYAGKLLGDSLRWTRPAPSPRRDGLGAIELRFRLTKNSRDLTAEERTDLAENLLRKLGLVRDFARFVVLCGHGSEVTNNPYKAGLDCGACGGHVGEPNAKVAAALLNSPQVRSELALRGIVVPSDTHFVAALHETVSDEIRFYDQDLAADALEAFETLRSIAGEASRATRAERAVRTSAGVAADALLRGRDWSEVRPEWGLAGNSAFIASRRSRTLGRSLGARCFLHSYDASLDDDERTLELILSAPVVVASWINLQYYASTVDNVAFGSGDKTVHDVVGRLGILSGNGGDLRTGLPWQSIHDGTKLQHDPLRLFVLVEASRDAIDRALERHPSVGDLFANGWAYLGSLEGDAVYLKSPDGEWEFRRDLADRRSAASGPSSLSLEASSVR